MLIHKELNAVVEGMSIPAQLSWSDTNPIAVNINLFDSTRQGWVEWTFALDIMAQGLTVTIGHPAGYDGANVRTWTSPFPSGDDMFMVNVHSPEGEATVSLSFDLVQHFVNRVVTEFSAEDEARAVALQVDTFLRDLNAESF